MWKKIKGVSLLVVGYLLSPLSWWNDLFFNLPIAYSFGYIFSLFSPDLLVPCSILGYWISNLTGILMMQFGAVDILQKQSKERNLKKDLLIGLASSSVYTVVIVLLLQLKLVDVTFLFPN
jgi:hypothetical protein